MNCRDRKEDSLTRNPGQASFQAENYNLWSCRKKSVLSQRGYIFDTFGGILYHHIKCILYIQHYSVNFTPSTKLSSYWIKEQGEKNWRPLQSESPGIQTFYWRKISSDQKQNVGNSHLPADSRAEVFDQDSVIRPGWGPVPETLNVENRVNTTWVQSFIFTLRVGMVSSVIPVSITRSDSSLVLVLEIMTRATVLV